MSSTAAGSGGDSRQLGASSSSTDGSAREAVDVPEEDDGSDDLSVHNKPSEPWHVSTGLTTAEAAELQKKWGRNELEEKRTPRWKLFLQQFYAPMPFAIFAAIVVEGAIENWPDFGVLWALQLLNGTVSFYEAAKANDAVAALKASLKPSAVCKRDGTWANLDAALLVPGDLVLLGSGAAVPADCRVNGGRIEVDQAALTGESLPVPMVRGSRPKMGSTVTRGEVEATVEFTGARTFIGKTATLIQSVEARSHFQLVLLRILFFLLGISLLFCSILLIYLLVRGEPGRKAISIVVVVLVASIPLAIEVVTTTTMAIGSRELAARHAIVARLAAIEELAGMNLLCSDKTGTLTLNKMVIQEETPCCAAGVDRRELLRQAALAAKWREPPKDALDTLVLGAADLPSLDRDFEQLDYMPFDPVLKRTEGTIRRVADGTVFKVAKGAPHVIFKLLHDRAAAERGAAAVSALAERGVRALAVARSPAGAGAEADWELVGVLSFLDPPRADTKEVLARAREFGIPVKMVTGDHVAIAKECARQLGIGTNILDAQGLPSLDADGKAPKNLRDYGPLIQSADGFAQVFPEHKFLIVEALRQQGFAVGMTGDGVNDAPALKKADIGIAVQGATDAARAAADIVLTSPGLSVVIDAITISRCIFQRIQSFVIYRVAATLQLLFFFFIAILAFHPPVYAQRRGARNVVVGTAADHWTGSNADGLNVAWHNRVCPLTSVFTASRENYSAPFPPGPDHWLGAPWLYSAAGNPSGNVRCSWVANSSSAYADPAAAAPFPGYPPPAVAQAGWVCSGPICVERFENYFFLPVIALIIITVLNDGTIISIAYDHVRPSKFPEVWNLPVQYCISGCLGGVALASSLLLLHFTLGSHDTRGFWVRGLGLPPLTYGQVVAALYLKVSISDFLTLFSARTRGFFFTLRPAWPLLGGAVLALSCSTLLAAFWPFNESKDTKLDGFARGARRDRHASVLGVVWLYCFMWWIVQDTVKVLLYALLFRTGVMTRATTIAYRKTGRDADAAPPAPSMELAAAAKATAP